ncbi:NotI family restriction endonuclease [Humibacillus xanthopallidus]|uniref:NotI family restriction endonuclease n=1 Tax=Humibacillus xanthopallidus TaxID=412689 RepID=UPI001639A25D|nr:NotI family restriction endonuclease [Humibacillus xanthopallidus]
MPRTITRWGVGEWFGTDLLAMEPTQFLRVADLALQAASDARQQCPFAAAIVPGARCSKRGGVCSLHPVEQVDGQASVSNDLVAACPNRFLENGDLLRWAAEVMLGNPRATAVRETPILRRAGLALDGDSGSAGRIDWLLVDDAPQGRRLAALETQSLYFSGHNMVDDFERYRVAEDVLMPAKPRRPDYRSGGPKRLAPQLSLKVPLLRNWGIKTAVLVDRYFFEQMSRLATTSGRTDRDKLAASDVVWLVAEFAGNSLGRGEVHYASLAASITALDAAEPMSMDGFFDSLDQTLQAASPTKVIPL